MSEYYINLFYYENWANEEIIGSILKIENPSERILSLMSHILNARVLWLDRIQNKVSDIKVWGLFNKTELVSINKEINDNLMSYLNRLTGAELERVIDYTNSKGEKFQSAVKDILTHLSHHSAYHRGQVVILLKEFTSDLPYTDYIHYVRSVKK